jgi:hypothetical protein
MSGRRPRLVQARRVAGLTQVDEAAQSALDAVESGRVAPSNRWRVLEVVRAAESAGTQVAAPLREAYRALVHSNRPAGSLR